MFEGPEKKFLKHIFDNSGRTPRLLDKGGKT